MGTFIVPLENRQPQPPALTSFVRREIHWPRIRMRRPNFIRGSLSNDLQLKGRSSKVWVGKYSLEAKELGHERLE